MTSNQHISRALKLAQVGVTNPQAICNGHRDRRELSQALLDLQEQLQAAERQRDLLQREADAANARKDELWTRLLDMENKYLDTHEQLQTTENNLADAIRRLAAVNVALKTKTKDGYHGACACCVALDDLRTALNPAEKPS